MKMYADLPARRAAQLAADLLVLGWVVLWVWLGRVVHSATLELLAPARALEGAGNRFGATMTDAGRTLRKVPLVGDQLQRPFDNAAGTGGELAGAGRQLGEAVEQLALVLGLVTALIPILIVVVGWLLARWRFVRRATAAQRFIDADADLDLFALRALARQPMHRLAAVSDDPARGWRNGDPAVIKALALLELRNQGLRPPVASGSTR